MPLIGKIEFLRLSVVKIFTVATDNLTCRADLAVLAVWLLLFMASVTPYCCWLGKHLCECWNLCAYDELPAFARLKEATSDRGVLLACLAQGDKVN